MENTEKKLEQTIREKPGISFSQLKRESGLANGVLQYHIRKSVTIEKQREGLIIQGYCDKCELEEVCRQKCLLKELRKGKSLEIVKLLSKGYKQIEIAEELDLNRSTINYHIKKLEKIGILKKGNPNIDIDTLDI